MIVYKSNNYTLSNAYLNEFSTALNIFSVVINFLSSGVIAVLALVTVSIIKSANGVCCPIDDSGYITHHVCLGLPYEIPMPLDNFLGINNPMRRNVLRYSWPEFNVDNIYWIRNRADLNRPKCMSRFCADGSHATDSYCGVGKCNSIYICCFIFY